ncbi:MAG: hypothetical protein NTX50_08615 [Candidatus Sumerlaeota bacterium]|nr:hypothetical protein [Candidatus Sumerlaeota bacterium]
MTSDLLKRCLDDLEARIDPDQEASLIAEWIGFSSGKFRGEVFAPRRARASKPQCEWPVIRVNESLEDFDKMALQQYATCSQQLANATGAPLTVRANYGTSILPLLFGVEPFIMPEETNTLPTSVPFHDKDAVKKIIGAGVPPLTNGYAARVFEMGERFQAIASQYPKIGKYVHVYHPDTQGPLDICEVVWGSEIFLAFYDNPELVREMLELVTQTYVAFMRAWERIVPFRKDFNAHWGLYHQGAIMLRSDSAMNLSGDLYEEFIRSFDQRLLDEFGGGAIHFCGRGDHYIAHIGGLRGLYGVNLSQPHLNDMETIFANTIDRGINLLDLSAMAVGSAREQGRNLCGRVHCAAWA